MNKGVPEPEPARLVHIKPAQVKLETTLSLTGCVFTCEAPGIAGPGVMGCAMRS